MRTVRSTVLMALLTLLIMTAGANAQTAGNSTQMAAAPHGLTTQKPQNDGRSVLFIDRFVAMTGGAVIAALAADVLLDAGGPYTIVLGTLGIVVGDWWYKEGMWPFNKPNQMPLELTPDPRSPFSDLMSQAPSQPAQIW